MGKIWHLKAVRFYNTDNTVGALRCYSENFRNLDKIYPPDESAPRIWDKQLYPALGFLTDLIHPRNGRYLCTVPHTVGKRLPLHKGLRRNVYTS